MPLPGRGGLKVYDRDPGARERAKAKAVMHDAEAVHAEARAEYADTRALQHQAACNRAAEMNAGLPARIATQCIASQQEVQSRLAMQARAQAAACRAEAAAARTLAAAARTMAAECDSPEDDASSSGASSLAVVSGSCIVVPHVSDDEAAADDAQAGASYGLDSED